MAIMNCPECHYEISSDVRVCPNCGFQLFNMTTWWGTAIAVIVVCISFGYLLNKYTSLPAPYLISLLASIALGIYGYNARRKPDES